ncbi:hypothetical protein T10_995 [Trichinella papuae]|uniref:Uncharacterized protein n=1 Tax=Trichinella papuae TaxID=268474 RepID=A0A0V1LYD7_9BILA|nr:hypothetical protein T10_995 [Trichinella papuae]
MLNKNLLRPSKSSGIRPGRLRRNFRISHSVERKRLVMREATKNQTRRRNKRRWSTSRESSKQI